MSDLLSFEETSRFLDTPKGKLHYHVAGDGPPLLLLHGSGPGVSGWANFRGNLPVFARDYTTWSYTEGTAAYAAKLNGLVTSDELPVLESAYATPGVAGQRTGEKQVSKGSGTIDSIRSFAANTITFLVTLNQQVTSTQPSSTQSGQWAVTVVSSAGGWQVNDIELSNLGNH